MSDGKLSTWKNQGKSWFLGIGINSYKEFPNLTNAVRDVLAINKLLTNEYDIQEDCTYLLLNEEATEERIIDTLDFLAKSVEENDKLIIYYSGHGKINRDLNQGYWLPHDAKAASAARYLLNSTVQDYVAGIDAKHILLISDACFSGSMFMRGENRSVDYSDELEDRVSRWALCSGRHDEEVYDGDPGGHSPFAQSLINVLSDAKKPFLPVGSIVHHVIEETASNYEQLPDGRPMYGVGHKGGQYIFRRKNHSAQAVEKKVATENINNKTKKKGFQSQYVSSTEMSDEAGLKMVKWIALTVLGTFVIVGGIIVGSIYLSSDGDTETSSSNIVFDQQDNSYFTAQINGAVWLASNMNVQLDGVSTWAYRNENDHHIAERGRLYTYAGAELACKSLKGNWALPSIEDYKMLTEKQDFPLLNESNNSTYVLENDFVKQLVANGRSGLNLTFGGMYLIDRNEYSPKLPAEMTEGFYWVAGRNRLYIQDEGTEYIAQISPVPNIWNHAYSCRCIKRE